MKGAWLLQHPREPAVATAAADAEADADGESESAPMAVFSCAARNLETLEHFVSLFDPARWCVEDVSDEARAGMGGPVFCHDSLLSAGSGADARERTRLLRIMARGSA